MKLKKLIAALLGVSCMISALALPVQAQTADEDSAYALEVKEEQYTYPTLPDNIRISDLADIGNNKDYYLGSDTSAVYLDKIYAKVVKDASGTGFQRIFLTADEKAALETATDEIIAMVNLSWNDLTKIIFIHDYLTSTVYYDATLTKYSAYNLLVEGTAVCQGYAEAFWYLMYKLGIDCKVV